VSSQVQAVVDLYGPADLTTPFAVAHDQVKKFMGGREIDEALEDYRMASPIQHVSRDDPPTLVLHGTIDQIVSVKQSDALVEKLKQCGVPHRYGRIEGWPHAMDVAKDVNDWCQSQMVHFFDEYLQPPRSNP
jgi:dipeptidyl aminopeptidase/acylaminoacyl peptidase